MCSTTASSVCEKTSRCAPASTKDKLSPDPGSLGDATFEILIFWNFTIRDLDLGKFRHFISRHLGLCLGITGQTRGSLCANIWEGPGPASGFRDDP